MDIVHAQASGGEGFFWLIVVIATIISQLVKASRQKGGDSPPAPSGSGADSGRNRDQDPLQELQSFFESLNAPQNKRQQETARSSSQPATRQAIRRAKPVTPMAKARSQTAAPSRPAPISKHRLPHEPGLSVAQQVAKRFRNSTHVRAQSLKDGDRSAGQPKRELVPQQGPRRTPIAQPTATKSSSRHATLTAENLRSFLRDQQSAREAMVLREVLDKPLALRKS